MTEDQYEICRNTISHSCNTSLFQGVQNAPFRPAVKTNTFKLGDESPWFLPSFPKIYSAVSIMLQWAVLNTTFLIAAASSGGNRTRYNLFGHTFKAGSTMNMQYWHFAWNNLEYLILANIVGIQVDFTKATRKLPVGTQTFLVWFLIPKFTWKVALVIAPLLLVTVMPTNSPS